MNCFLSAFDRQCRRRPNASALVHEERLVSYAELQRMSEQVADRLHSQGIVRGTAVALMCERSIEAIVAMLGILRAGGVFVPVDRALPNERIDYMLRDASVGCIVSDAACSSQGLPAHLPVIDAVSLIRSLSASLNVAEPVSSAPHVLTSDQQAGVSRPQDRAYIMFTSGSTGQPKGVPVSHGALACYCTADVHTYQLLPQDRTLQFATLSFDICIEEIFPPLCIGSTVVLRPSMRSDAQIELSDIIERYQVSAVHLATGYWHEWVDLMHATGGRVPRSLRLMVVTGEKVSPEHYHRWCSLTDHAVLWANAYGPTETTVSATVFIPSAQWQGSALPIGVPLPGYTAHILNDQGQPVDVGDTGELYIGGGALAEGYLNRPEQTAAAFVPDPFSSLQGARLYRTGDLARWLEDGNIEYAGRVDHQIKLGSYRIEPGEVENAINTCSGVRESLVRLVEYAGQRQLIAYVALADARLQPVDVATELSTRLPVWMMPSRYVLLDQLPKTLNGKIDRQALPNASDAVTPRRADIVPPSTDTERSLCRIWCEVLGVSEISIDDSFISLGGDSLMAVRAIARIQQQLDFTVTTRDFFFLDTVALLAGHLQGKGVVRRVPPPVPSFINTRGRQLYTVLQRPMPARCNGLGLLLVPPLGNEQRRTQRPFRSLMQHLSRRGYTLLRFDWRGTGNSSGDTEDLTQLTPWIDDLQDAAELLAAHVDSLDVVAIRAGALIAAQAPLVDVPVARRFYWDPVTCGRLWLEQMQALHLGILNDTFRFLKSRKLDIKFDTDAGDRSSDHSASVFESAGMCLRSELCEALAAVSLSDVLESCTWNKDAQLLIPASQETDLIVVMAKKIGLAVTVLPESNDWLDPRATTRDMLITHGARYLADQLVADGVSVRLLRQRTG